MDIEGSINSLYTIRDYASMEMAGGRRIVCALRANFWRIFGTLAIRINGFSDAAEHIFGAEVGALKGKTNRRRPHKVQEVVISFSRHTS